MTLCEHGFCVYLHILIMVQYHEWNDILLYIKISIIGIENILILFNDASSLSCFRLCFLQTRF